MSWRSLPPACYEPMDQPVKALSGMARFFFTLNECGSVTEDEEGRELSPDAVVEVALLEARTIMCEEVRDGRLCLNCTIKVRNELGELVLTLPFRDAIHITGRTDGDSLEHQA